MWAEFDLFSGNDDGETTIRDFYKEVTDKWAGASYRQDVAAILLSRCLHKLVQDPNAKEES